MTALIIRATQPESDYETVVRLMSAVEREPVSVEQLQNWLERIPDEDIFEEYTGLVDGQIVAFGSIFRSVTAKIPKMSLEVIVDEAQRKQGYGTQMYEHVLAHAKQHNSTRLTIRCREDLSESIAFAEKRGFYKEHLTFNSILDVTKI